MLRNSWSRKIWFADILAWKWFWNDLTELHEWSCDPEWIEPSRKSDTSRVMQKVELQNWSTNQVAISINTSQATWSIGATITRSSASAEARSGAKELIYCHIGSAVVTEVKLLHHQLQTHSIHHQYWLTQHSKGWRYIKGWKPARATSLHSDPNSWWNSKRRDVHAEIAVQCVHFEINLQLNSPVEST